MIVEINTEQLIKEGLTSSQYVLLCLIWQNNYAEAALILQNDQGLVNSLPELVEKKFVLKLEKTTIIIDRKKVQALLELKDDFFWELYNTYPAKVFVKGGNRTLRSLSHDSWDAKTCKRKYEAKVKTLAKHEHVMACLEAELAERRRKRDGMAYMQNFETWINQSSWEKSEPLLESKTLSKIQPRYGEGLV